MLDGEAQRASGQRPQSGVGELLPSINLILEDLLSRNQRLKLHFSHCPSHSGVRFNELVDRMASDFIINDPHPPIVLKQHFIDAGILKADADWRESSRLTSYRGRGWLMIRRNKRVFTPQVKNKGARQFFINMADNGMYHMARLTRAVTYCNREGPARFADCRPSFIKRHCQLSNAKERPMIPLCTSYI